MELRLPLDFKEFLSLLNANANRSDNWDCRSSFRWVLRGTGCRYAGWRLRQYHQFKPLVEKQKGQWKAQGFERFREFVGRLNKLLLNWRTVYTSITPRRTWPSRWSPIPKATQWGWFRRKLKRSLLFQSCLPEWLPNHELSPRASVFVRCSAWFLFMAVNRRDGRKKAALVLRLARINTSITGTNILA